MAFAGVGFQAAEYQPSTASWLLVFLACGSERLVQHLLLGSHRSAGLSVQGVSLFKGPPKNGGCPFWSPRKTHINQTIPSKGKFIWTPWYSNIPHDIVPLYACFEIVPVRSTTHGEPRGLWRRGARSFGRNDFLAQGSLCFPADWALDAQF